MLRSALSRARAGNRSKPPHMEAGVPRTVATVVVLPTVAVAAGMHFSPEFRTLVDENVPGAVDALSKATGVDYDKASTADAADAKKGSTLPESYETLPGLLKRIGDEEKEVAKAGAGKPSTGKTGGPTASEANQDAAAFMAKAKAAASNGAAEASSNAAKLAEKAAAAAKSAESSLGAFGSSAGDAAKSAAGSVKDAAASAKDSASDAVKSGSSAWGPGIDQVKSNAGAAGGAVSDVASAGADALKSGVKTAGDKLSSVEAPKVDFTTSVAKDPPVGDGPVPKAAGSGNSATSEKPSVDGESGSSPWWKFGFGGGSGSAPAAPSIPSAPEAPQAKPSGSVSGETADSGDKFARLFGKGDFDPAAVEGKDVVDVRVYERPSYLESTPAAPPPTSSGWSGSAGTTGKTPPPVGGKTSEVEALQAELKSQAKWDAVRLQEAVRAQSVAEKKIAAAELAAASKKHKLELSKAQEKAMADAQGVIDAKVKEMQAQMEMRRDADVAKLLKEREAELKVSLESEYLQREREAAGEREQELLGMKASVDALHEDLDQSREHRKASQTASAVAASAFSLKDALSGSGSFASELKTASQTSEIGALVAASIPAEASSDGLPTSKELKDAFGRVSMEGRKAALIPEDEVGSLWAHLLAGVVSRIKVAVDTGNEPFVPFTDEERIRLAESRVNSGDLKGAVESLEGLKGLPAEVVSDWVAMANARIAADVGAQALLADAITTQQALASMSQASGDAPPENVGCYW